jgi:hypothetical protein
MNDGPDHGAEVLAVVLTTRILDILRESGATAMESYSALNAAKALVPALLQTHAPVTC